MKQLPSRSSSFPLLRSPEHDFVFVDKTDILSTMLSRSQFVLLTRPRLFGKSLLASTLADLFANGLVKFTGLRIEKTWKDRRYPVISLDFSRISGKRSREEFLQALDAHLVERLQAAGFDAPQVNRIDPILRWEKFLARARKMTIVLIVDDYDAPLLDVLDDPARLEEVQAVIGSFFGATKSCSGRFRFVLATGITRISQAAIPAAFNFLTDISSMTLFGGLLGFTESELTSSFSPWIENASAATGATFEQTLERLKTWYGGYCFDGEGRTHVHSPWSVLNFLARPERGFVNYWFRDSCGETSASLLLNYFRIRDRIDPGKFDRHVYVSIDSLRSPSPASAFNIAQILTNMGYLTIKGASPDGMATLGFPNEEVKSSIARLLKTNL